MAIIRTLEELDALYDVPVPTSITKEVDHLTPLHCEYIAGIAVRDRRIVGSRRARLLAAG